MVKQIISYYGWC